MPTTESILRLPRTLARLGWIAAALTLCSRASFATRYYVDAAAPSGGDGLAWTSAWNTLDVALAQAVAGDEVWVKQGRYSPRNMTVPPDARSATFSVHAGVMLYGGFLGTESSLPALGDPRLTVLDGNIQDPNLAADNCYHIVTIRQAVIGSGTTMLDGFVIRGAHSPGEGGGLITNNGSLLLSRCWFSENHARSGGALWWQVAGVKLRFCTFSRNSAADRGGAIYTRTSSPRVYNCRFEGNTAGQYGGALCLESIGSVQSGLDPDPYARFVNCLFARNWAPFGGAAYLSSAQFNSGKAKWLSCTFAENNARFDGASVHAAIGGLAAISVIRNSILWNSSAPAVPQLGGQFHYVRFCDVQQTTWLGVNADNLNLAPGLTPFYSLSAGSPLIDRGNADYQPADDLDLDDDGNTTTERVPYDLAGNNRAVDVASIPDLGIGYIPYLDIGAFEAP